MFPRWAPHEVAALPLHYYLALRDYYLATLPEKPETEEDSTVIDFDKEVLKGAPT